MPDQVRRDAIRLYRFLKEFTELRTETVRSVDTYEQVLWLADIPRQPECSCAAWERGSGEPSDVWIEIQRPKAPAVPGPPDVLRPWLVESQVGDCSIEVPGLRQEATVGVLGSHGESQLQPRRLDEQPEVRRLWERYIEQEWRPWRDERRRVDTIQNAYTTLFSIYQKQQRLGEQYEVILGLGLLNWRIPSGHLVRRHLIATHAQIAFDSRRGVISVGPGAEGAKPVLCERRPRSAES